MSFLNSIKDWLMVSSGGAARWVWLLAFVVLPVLNEVIRRMQWTRAQGIIHLVLVQLLKVFGGIPLLGDMLRWLDGPQVQQMPVGEKEKPIDPPNLPPPPPPGPKAAILPFALLPFLFFGQSGCLCGQAAHAQDLECVVKNQAVDCTVDAAGGLTPTAVADLMILISGQQPDWGAFAQKAEAMGFKDAGCLLAALVNDFTQPSASPHAINAKVMVGQGLREAFESWKVKHKATAIKFCYGAVCQ